MAFLPLILLLFTPLAAGRIGVDVSQPVSESVWACLKAPGGQGPIEYAIARLYRSSGSLDMNGINTVKAARAAGVARVAGYLFPCVTRPGETGKSQVTATMDAVRAAGADIDMLWLDIERYDWPANTTGNRAFVEDLMAGCDAAGVRCGIYASAASWEPILGLDYSVPFSRGLPLWYAHYDKQKTFADFKPFGGYTEPALKQYIGDATSCGVGIDYNWFP